MSYKSPIEIGYDDYMHNMAMQIRENNEMHIMAAVNQVVSVDKEELIKALNYDRQQYEKGYQEGHIDGVLQAEKLYARPIGKWETPFTHNGKTYHKCNHCHVSSELILINNYCPNCGAKMVSSEKTQEV